MKYDDIVNEMIADSSFDLTNLVSESAKTPYLFSKYNILYHEEKLILEKLKTELAIIKKKRTEYYLGYASDEVYKENPFYVKIHRNDLDTYLNSDEEYYTQYLRVSKQETKIALIKEFLNDIRTRSFTIKNINDTRRFESGG